MTGSPVDQIGAAAELLLDRGGWTMAALLCLSVAALMAAIVSALRFAALRPFQGMATGRGTAANLAAHLRRRLLRGDDRELVAEEAALLARGYLRQARTGFRLLELIVTTAPLLGLLGTVLGMIDAFQAMQSSGEAVKPADLAGGIWEALITTAAGMVIALLALALHALLDALVDRFRFRLEVAATEALETVPEPPHAVTEPATAEAARQAAAQ
ncbi:MotA/TolQ/ExbB proton channel family protein [Stappia taiwanensis]|uniref:MotA/TolQ/ExbB proton channel family protein n=1 Tax=Stappia taiwanensis TaxID=992267 RepID=A0A838XRX7_9HYPH|nr:MotA/TolQ/ExbB proton channel family protein [Stappia taiwanensis]MBA4613072.1 MotA/TolQ/ExbB proton channel family protein [Stappia taiwanensis]GGF01471.1 hypothetical protein GCM10007285_31320 [Stappia taiwanensis]